MMLKTNASFILLVWLAHVASPQGSEGGGFYSIPGLNHTVYFRSGDINIGVLLGIYSSPSNTTIRCNKLKITTTVLQRMEAIIFAVETINNSTWLLPNITLGFVILDECDTDNTALAQSLSFLPMTADTCFANICNSTSSSVLQPSSYSDPSAIRHYDVIGVIGPNRSDRSIAIALLYSIARIPIISYKATTDALSDKTNYRYFLRVVPPDIHQVTAMLTFIENHNWTYISVVYSAGSYGDPAFDNIQSIAAKKGICIATSRRVLPESNFRQVAKALIEYSRARVVILFIFSDMATRILKEIHDLKAAGSFVWIGSDAWASSISNLTNYIPEVAGTFTFAPVSKYVPELDEYARSQVPANSKNPWMAPTWELLTNCSLANNTCSLTTPLPDLIKDYSFAEGCSNVLDSVFAFGYAVHKLIQELCPDARKAEVRHCVKGEKLLQYLLNISFEGYTGTVQFDAQGDVMTQYRISQVSPAKNSDGNLTGKFSETTVAYYSIKTKSIKYVELSNLSWEFFSAQNSDSPWQYLAANEQPESICSYPCKEGQFKIPSKLDCCWDCRSCRENEKMVWDLEIPRCEVCPQFTWPDQLTNRTSCAPIPISFPSFSSTLPLFLVVLGIIAMICTLAVMSAYIYLRDVRVIKAASRELSFLQLVAILVGYITVICFQSTPTHVTCSALYFMFCLSFTWLYSPLLVKAVRIFRIFQSGTKGKQRPRFISPVSQLVMAVALIVLQVLICVAMALVYKPTSKLTQPVATNKFVELSCDMTLPGLASFLAYNLIIVGLCSVFAFKTRKLPDNFNESRFMSMCLSSTLVIWLAFIPTYLTAAHESVRVLLLSVALLLNHTVALVFLFVPKIYAGVYLPPEETMGVVTQRPQNTQATFGTSLNRRNNQITPSTLTEPSRVGF